MTALAPMPVAGVPSIVFLGTPEIAVPHLEALVASGCNVELVVTRPDVRRGRGNIVTASPVKVAAQKLGIPVSHAVSDALEIAERKSNLLGVVVAFGELITPDVLKRVPMVNVHFSLLPRWRGAAPVERAILAGDTRTGVCIMRVVEALDEGEVFGSQEILIEPEDDASTLRLKLNQIAINLLLKKVRGGFGDGVDQVGEAVYAKKIKSADLQIDWQGSAIQILRQVRVGGAFTFVNRKRIKILHAELVAGALRNFKPGRICELTKTSCIVATADSAVSIVEVQPEGKAAMTVEEWLNGARINAEFVFGLSNGH